VWAADHTHALAGGTPILALDMYEHAFHIDFGTNAAAYVDAFMANLHWPRIAARFGGSVSEPAQDYIDALAARQRLEAEPGLVVIDARLAARAAARGRAGGAGGPARRAGAPARKDRRNRGCPAARQQGAGLLRLGLRDRRRLRRPPARTRHRCRDGRGWPGRLARRRTSHRTT